MKNKRAQRSRSRARSKTHLDDDDVGHDGLPLAQQRHAGRRVDRLELLDDTRRRVATREGKEQLLQHVHLPARRDRAQVHAVALGVLQRVMQIFGRDLLAQRHAQNHAALGRGGVDLRAEQGERSARPSSRRGMEGELRKPGDTAKLSARTDGIVRTAKTAGAGADVHALASRTDAEHVCCARFVMSFLYEEVQPKNIQSDSN